MCSSKKKKMLSYLYLGVKARKSGTDLLQRIAKEERDRETLGRPIQRWRGSNGTSFKVGKKNNQKKKQQRNREQQSRNQRCPSRNVEGSRGIHISSANLRRKKGLEKAVKNEALSRSGGKAGDQRRGSNAIRVLEKLVSATRT